MGKLKMYSVKVDIESLVFEIEAENEDEAIQKAVESVEEESRSIFYVQDANVVEDAED